jgi:uncharacterized protein YbbK (DUF523 family)
VTAADDKPRVGVSACLLGAKVRYDGEDKRDAIVCEQLAPLVAWIAICPELEVGMGVPRESVRLQRAPAGPRMLGNDTGADWTARMNAYAAGRVRALEGERLCGFVLKSKSPSCGGARVKLYASAAADAPVSFEGVGLFAAALRARFPDLPVEEAEALHDPATRAAFVERVLAYRGARGHL